MSEFVLPDVGEGLTEAEIVSWRVAPGDVVNVNDVLVEIETAKSIVELPSPYAGAVTALLVEEGATVPVGTPIIAIGEAEAEPVEPVGTDQREPALVGYGARSSGPPTPSQGACRHRDGRPAARRARRSCRSPTCPGEATGAKLARDLGIDVAEVPASGSSVTRADVQAFAAMRSNGAAAAAELAPAAASEDVRVPVRGVRKAMAEAMVHSVRTAPHATEWLSVDVSRTIEWIARLHQDPAFDGIRLTPTAVVAKAVCMAMRHTPSLNAQWLDDPSGNAQLVMRQDVNLGIAVATERGLVVPNIKAADKLALVELARSLDRLTSTARAGETQPADQSGGSFTITNIGVFGVDAGTPILNVGEAGILAVGAIERRPWVAEDDTIVPRWVTTLALSFDHRIVDGAEAARFLSDVGAILRDPATALTY